MQYDNEKTIVLFKNDFKKSETQPDYKGELTVDGVTYNVAVWAKQSQKGRDMLRGKLEVREEVPNFEPTAATLSPGRGKDTEDIPF